MTYPGPQQIRAQAPDRDTLLERVTRLDGWPVRVRHDTLDLQVARWYADGRAHEMEPADFTVAVAPETRARIGDPDADANRVLTRLLVGAAVLAAVLLAVLAKLYEDY